MAILTLPNDRLVLGPLDVSLLEHFKEYYEVKVEDDYGTVRGVETEGAGASEDNR